MDKRARRVGKYTIAEEFAKKEFKSYILIDFAHTLPKARQAIETYLETNNLQEIDVTKREIVDLYEEDFTKIDSSGLAGDIYDAIPANLSGNASRYVLASAREGTSFFVSNMRY